MILGLMQNVTAGSVDFAYFDFGNKDADQTIVLISGYENVMSSWNPILLQSLADGP